MKNKNPSIVNYSFGEKIRALNNIYKLGCYHQEFIKIIVVGRVSNTQYIMYKPTAAGKTSIL